MRLTAIICILIIFGANVTGVVAVSPSEEMTGKQDGSTIQETANETLQITGSVSKTSPPERTAIDHTVRLSFDPSNENRTDIIFTEEYERANIEVKSVTETGGAVNVSLAQDTTEIDNDSKPRIIIQPVTNITGVSIDITVKHPNVTSITGYPLNVVQPTVTPERSNQIDLFSVRPIGDDSRSDVTGEFDRISGSGFVYQGATVFQGERDIQFRGRLTTPVIKTEGQKAGVPLEPPIPADAPTGTYSTSGANDSASIRVEEPKITTLRVENSRGVDITGDTVYPGATSTIPIIAQSNFETAEFIEITILNENGLDVTNEVIQTERARPETATGRPAVTQDINSKNFPRPSTLVDNIEPLKSSVQAITSVHSRNDRINRISPTPPDGGQHEQLVGGIAAERSVAETDIEPGESTSVTINATTGAGNQARIEESFSPNVKDTNIERITVNGEQVSPFFSFARSDSLFIAFNDIPANADVSVEYTLSTSESDETYQVSGTVRTDTRTISLDDTRVIVGDGGRNSEVTSNGKVRWNADLSEVDGSSFSIIATGSDDFDTDASRASTEISISYDTPSVSVSTTRPSRGQNVDINVKNGVYGAVYSVNIDANDLQDSLSVKEYYNLFRNVGTTQQIGVVTQSGEIFIKGTTIRGTPDRVFAQVRVDNDGEATTRIRSQLLKSTASIALAKREADVAQAGDNSATIAQQKLNVVDSGVELTAPRNMITGAETSVSGTVTSGVDTVVMYAKANNQFERIDLDAKRDGTVSDLTVDGTDFNKQRRLTVGDAPGNDILSFPGRHRVAVLSKASLLSSYETVPTVLSRPELMTKPVTISPLTVRQTSISLNPIDTDGQAATTADGINVSGEVRGEETALIIAIDQRGSIESRTVETANFSVELPAGSFSAGTIDVFAISLGRDMRLGDGNIPETSVQNDADSQLNAFQTYVESITERRTTTKQQIKSVVYNETSRDTASDDPVVVRELRLSDPTISIDVPAANQGVSKGKRLFVNGTTNVGKDRGLIDITLTGQNQSVRSGSIIMRREGTWNGSVRTSGLSPGRYTISASIEGKTVRKEITIN